MGELEPWDAYFTAGSDTGGAFGKALGEPQYVTPFLTALRFAHTLITNAEWDTAIFAETIPFALRAAAESSANNGWLSGVEYEGSDDLEHSTERFHVHFNARPGREGPLDRTVYFPFYPRAGHMVPAGDSAQFAADVQRFMVETGLAED